MLDINLNVDRTDRVNKNKLVWLEIPVNDAVAVKIFKCKDRLGKVHSRVTKAMHIKYANICKFMQIHVNQ